MTDALLEHVAALDHITVLKIGGSHGVTDVGFTSRPAAASRASGARRLFDHGREPVRARRDASTPIGVARVDARERRGAANLAACEELESVNLMGTHMRRRRHRSIARKAHGCGI